MDLEYSALSHALNEQITKETRKNEGIYFTPISCINKNIEILKPYISKRKIYDILEPSCGSCEFILSLNKMYPKCKITCIEQNEDIFNSIKQLSTNNIQLSCDNFLEKEITHKYDFIIGNPPYFVMKKGHVEQSYFEYFEGRPNIFILFMLSGYDMFRVFLIRIFKKKNPFVRSRDHLHDYLIKKFSLFTTLLILFIYIIFFIFLYHLQTMNNFILIILSIFSYLGILYIGLKGIKN